MHYGVRTTSPRNTIRAAMGAIACVLTAAEAIAQQPAPVPPPVAGKPTKQWEIVDNSFLVEEAFNQDPGVVQNISSFLRLGSGWAFGFTQEWPVGGVRHQFSYSIPALNNDGFSGVGDVTVNYRLQVSEEANRRPAFAPRATIILPTGDPNHGTGEGVVGWQFNLPFSKQLGNFYVHWNAGLTVVPREPSASGAKATLTSPAAAASLVWRARPMINVLIENVEQWTEQLNDAGVTSRVTSYTVSPGVRGGWNIGDAQLILGAAVPVVWTNDRAETGWFLYFSYELPFRR